MRRSNNWGDDLLRDFEQSISNPFLHDSVSTDLSAKQTVGEILHICRPLLHLFSMLSWGEKSWRPFILSLATDCASIHFSKSVAGDKKLLGCEQEEIHTRQMALLFYLLRSPLYDRVTKTHIIALMNWCKDWVPLARHVINPLEDYLPTWQNIYAHCWSS